MYHIENYLLEPDIILNVLGDLRPGSAVPTKDEIYAQLKDAAKECVPSLVRHVLQTEINQQVVSLINTKIDPKELSIADGLFNVLSTSKSRLDQAFSSVLSIENLRNREHDISKDFYDSLNDDQWRQKHRGRDILRRFAGNCVKELKYEIFRNLLMSKMAAIGYKPIGMKAVIDQVLDA